MKATDHLRLVYIFVVIWSYEATANMASDLSQHSISTLYLNILSQHSISTLYLSTPPPPTTPVELCLEGSVGGEGAEIEC